MLLVDPLHMKYQSNTLIIDELNKKIVQSRHEFNAFRQTCEALTKPFDYMNMLIKAIRENPGLQDEWLAFLELAGIPEPSWKAEYTTTEISFE